MTARIFLSCGQNPDYDEPAVVADLVKAIRSLGYEVYCATETQSYRSLRENIFDALKNADYFVFVDFAREALNGSSGCRGSLFSHQELAIASFLELPAIYFRERGAQEEGMLRVAFQGNAHVFNDRTQLPDLVKNNVHSKLDSGEWPVASRNCLTLHPSVPIYVDAEQPDPSIIFRHFHIEVSNNNAHRAATNCFAYLDSVVSVETGKELAGSSVEFKWAGTGLPGVRIRPRSKRKFDAFYFRYQRSRPEVASLGWKAHSDSSDYYPKITAPGKYRLLYTVTSDNFPDVSQPFLLEFGHSLNSVSFRPDPDPSEPQRL